MALTKFDSRQSVNRSALPMVGSAANDSLDTILAKIDPELSKLYEDRNVLLTDGGLVTFTGTQLQFTDNLLLSINSQVAGGAPTVINLNSTTRTLSATGRMLYAVVNRTGGTASVTDDATTLPSVVSANQEVFLIAKRVDATDGTQRVYFRNGFTLSAGQTFRLGSAGSGSGSGTGDDIDALQYNASFTEPLSDLPTSTVSSIDTGAGKTNATYSATNKSYAISYDASKTVTGTGTAMTLSGTPGYTVAVGDILRVGTQARRITVVTTQTSYTIESAFTVDPSAAAATVSQAVYTKDINNFAADGIALSAIYTDSLSDALITYNDTSSGTIYNNTDPALVGFTASADGTTYSSVGARESNLSLSQAITSLPTTSTSLFIRFFSNKTSGSGTVNLVGYKAFFHRNTSTESGGISLQAICFTDSTGTPVGCSNPAVVSGKTRIALTNQTYPVGVNSGQPNGALFVTINGQKIPRFINSTLTPNASYTEVDAQTIALDTDYSGYNFIVEIYQYISVVDSNTQNTTNISTLNTHRFKNYVINSNLDFWQRNTSFTTPTSGVYGADRFVQVYDGTIGTFTISRQAFTLGQTDVPNEPSYFYRWNHTVAGSASTKRQIQHRVESVRTLAGKQATLTFWMKADSARTVGVHLNQTFGSGGSPSADVVSATQNVSLTTVWQQFTLTFAIPSISGKTLGTNINDYLAIFWELPLNTTMTIDLAQVMLNEGSVAAPYVYASGGSSLNYAAELLMCQRFFAKTMPPSVNVGSVNGSPGLSQRALVGTSSGSVTFQWSYPATTRSPTTAPTVTVYSPGSGASGKIYDTSSTADVTAITQTVGFQGATAINNAALTLNDTFTADMTAESEL